MNIGVNMSLVQLVDSKPMCSTKTVIAKTEDVSK
jgi:hypothetical protein